MGVVAAWLGGVGFCEAGEADCDVTGVGTRGRRPTNGGCPGDVSNGSCCGTGGNGRFWFCFGGKLGGVVVDGTPADALRGCAGDALGGGGRGGGVLVVRGGSDATNGLFPAAVFISFWAAAAAAAFERGVGGADGS